MSLHPRAACRVLEPMGLFDNLFGSKLLDKDAFARKAVQTLQRNGVQEPISYDGQRFQLVIGQPGQAKHLVYLGNHFEEYSCRPKGDRERVFDYFAQLPRREDRADADKEGTLRCLLPRLRPRTFASLWDVRLHLQIAGQLQGAAVPKLPHQAFCEHLSLNLCIDFPNEVSEVTHLDLERWNEGLDTLLPRALDNLRAMSGLGMRRGQHPGVFVSPYRDNHDPARLLLTEMIQALPLKGAPVAAVPNRNELIITGSNDLAGLAELVALTKMGLMDPRPLSSLLLTLEGGSWRPFTPPSDHPLASQLNLLNAQSILKAHAEQKELLDEWHDETGEDVFVASVNAFQTQGSGVVTRETTWAADVPALLPRADIVGLVEMNGDRPEDARVRRFTFESVLAAAGHRMEKVEGMYPERWRVDAFPTEEEIAAMQPDDLFNSPAPDGVRTGSPPRPPTPGRFD